MFSAWCARHSARVLLDPAAIESIDKIRDGYEIRFRCTDGWRGHERIRAAAPRPTIGLTPIAA